MNEFIENLLERPLSHKLGILIGTIGLIIFVFWIYIYSPKNTERDELAAKQAELQSQITHERRLAANLGKFRAEVKDLDVKLNIALQELPDKREIPDLLSSVSNLARDAGLEVNLFATKTENYQEFYAEVPVEIHVRGTYHEIATFFDEVGQLSRIVNITGITLNQPQSRKDVMTVNAVCTATTFRYLDEQERVEHQGGERIGRRR